MSAASEVDPTIEQRFWPKVAIDDSDKCWIWMAQRKPAGYGQLRFGPDHATTCAHRVAWLIVVGQIPDGMNVLHRCDNPSCVNPRHLFLGSHRDNMLDKERKGRANHPRGEENHAKLRTEDVLHIRRLYAAGQATQADLGRRFHVSPGYIWHLVNGSKWSHLTPPE